MEDDHSWRYQQNHNMFSTHILTRRMTISLYRRFIPDVFQLTSSQGGWRAIMYAIFSNISFSTHILTRRMTCPSPWKCTPVNFSTHILTRRMTDGKREQESSSHFFNSHPHKEDDIFIITVFTLTSFSTHILTRKMTMDKIREQNRLRFSTHILTRRMTVLCVNVASYITFQLTSSQGGWQRRELSWRRDKIFNSHPHKEDDQWNRERKVRHKLFQLTSSQGGWRWTSMKRRGPRTFQLTSSQGGWL